MWEAQNGVVLVRHVPVACIVGLECTTRAARGVEAELRARFGLRA
jgi:RNA:NAD 2'-phosphotransferase (TPT1/KptA family)